MIRLNILDLKGNLKLRSYLSRDVKDADGAILMLDLSREKSLSDINDWTQFLRQYDKDIPIILVGNKTDLFNSEELSSEERDRILSKRKEIIELNNFQDFFTSSINTGKKVIAIFARIIELMWNRSHITESKEENKPDFHASSLRFEIEKSIKKDTHIGVFRSSIYGNGFEIPYITISYPDPKGVAVIIHGYGECKEDLLGLSWKVAEAGLAVYCIDLRGHGEHMSPFGSEIVQDVEYSLNSRRTYGKVIAIGYSLGGRLALLSQTDYAIAISPLLNKEYSEETHKILMDLRTNKINEESPDSVFEILKELPLYVYNKDKPAKIIFGSRDAPEIVRDCLELKKSGVIFREVENGLRSDTFNLQSTFDEIVESMKTWFNLN